MLSRYTYFPLNDVTHTIRQGGKKPEISIVVIIVVIVNDIVIDKVFI